MFLPPSEIDTLQRVWHVNKWPLTSRGTCLSHLWLAQMYALMPIPVFPKHVSSKLLFYFHNVWLIFSSKNKQTCTAFWNKFVINRRRKRREKISNPAFWLKSLYQYNTRYKESNNKRTSLTSSITYPVEPHPPKANRTIHCLCWANVSMLTGYNDLGRSVKPNLHDMF